MVLDEDVSADIALMYPELYQDLMKVNCYLGIRISSFTLRKSCVGLLTTPHRDVL